MHFTLGMRLLGYLQMRWCTSSRFRLLCHYKWTPKLRCSSCVQCSSVACKYFFPYTNTPLTWFSSAVITSAIRLGFVPALITSLDATMAIAMPMNWSVVEIAVGILVSSMPAIRAIRYLWRKPGDGSYGSGAGHSTLKSGNGGHIQLYDVNNTKKGPVSDAESGRTRDAEANSSEEDLVGKNYGLKSVGQISRTTELEVSYSSK